MKKAGLLLTQKRPSRASRGPPWPKTPRVQTPSGVITRFAGSSPSASFPTVWLCRPFLFLAIGSPLFASQLVTFLTVLLRAPLFQSIFTLKASSVGQESFSVPVSASISGQGRPPVAKFSEVTVGFA